MDMEDSLDTTQELLDDTLPSTPDVVDSVIQDDSEEEIFFGNVSSKEKNGKNATFNRRMTIGMSESDRRRSFEKSKPVYRIKSRDVISLRDSLDSRNSLYGSEKSITEEEGLDLDDVFNMDTIATEKEASPQQIKENLPSLKLVNVIDDRNTLEVDCITDQGKLNEEEGLRNNTKEDASNFLEGHSFNIQDNSDNSDKTDDDIVCKKMFENDNVAVVENSLHLTLPPSIASNSFSSEASCDHDFPQPVTIDDSSSTEDPPIDFFSNKITCSDDLSLPTNDNKNDSTEIIDKRFSTEAPKSIINIQSMPTDGCQPFIFDSFSTDEYTDASDEKSPINCNVACPVLHDDNFSNDVTPPIGDVQDSFFSNSASYSISGIESLDSTSPLDISRTRDLNHQGSPTESIEGDYLLNVSPRTISGQSPLAPGDGTNFLSVPTERNQRGIPEPDVAAKGNFSLPSPNTIAQELSPVSRERMFSLMEDSTIDSSGDDSVFSNKCLDSNAEDTVSQSFLNLKQVDDPNERTNEIMDVEIFDNKTKSSDEVGNLSQKLNKEDNELEAEGLDKNDSMGEISVQKNVANIITEATKYDNDDEDLLEDILDVENDQLFDDSLYSMEDNTSRRLSNIGNNICLKWKKKENKTKKSCDEGASNHLISLTEASEHVDFMQEICQENMDATQESFCSVLESLPNSRDVSFCEETEDFNNTADEMVLYEMFGADYDEIVEKMTADEKRKLRNKLDARTKEDQKQTEENLKIQLSELDVSPISPSPSQKKSNSHMETCRPTSPVAMAPDSSLDKNSSAKSQNSESKIVVEKDCFRAPGSPARSSATEPLFKSPTYLQQTASSLHKRVTPSPSKHIPVIPWRPVSPHSKSFIPTPVRTGALVRTPLITTPQLVRTPGSGSLVRIPLLTTPQLSGGLVRTPGSSAKAKVPTSRAAQVDLNHHAIVSPSPLGTYLRDNKPPPLVHQVKAQSAVRDLESTLMEVENCENEAPVEACPLPEATYYASNLAKDNYTDATYNDYNIAEAYGQTNSLAKVTRHVGRVKVVGKTSGIHWGDELATDQSLRSSPSHNQLGPAGKSVLKKTQRDSGTFDESMVDVSVLETVAIKKIGRGTNKKKGK